MENNDFLDFSISDGEGTEVVDMGEIISNLVGVEDINDFTVSPDDIDVDFLDLDVDGEQVDSGIVHSGVDVVKVLAPYKDLTVAIIALSQSSTSDDKTSLMVVDHAEFSYMPEDVFRAFNSILIDVSTQKEYANLSIDECAVKALDLMFEVTQWSPTFNRPEFLTAFATWCNRFRRINATQSATAPRDILQLVDINQVQNSMYFFTLNTMPFLMVNSFFDEIEASNGNSAIDSRNLGLLTSMFLQQNGLQTLSIATATQCIMDYFRSDDLQHALGCSQDEMLEYTTGEILRRLLVYELSNEVLYPYGVREYAADNFDAVAKCLHDAIASGSIAAEIIYLIANMMSRVEYDEGKRSIPTTRSFLTSIMKYFQAYVTQDSLVNPIFYSSVKRLPDGTYDLGYTVRDETLTVHSDDILCDVVGDRSSVYCIPSFLVDATHGYSVCPPQTLIIPLRSVAISGRMKISGAVTFRYQPTTSWLEENKILVHEEAADTREVGTALRDSDNPLLPVLLEYTNSFDDDGRQIQPIVVATRGYLLHSVSRQIKGEANEIFLVEEAEDGNIIANSGSLVFDSDTKNLIVSFNALNGKYVEFVVGEDEYCEQYLGTSTDQDTSEFSMSDIVHLATKHAPIAYQEYRKAVKSLCELAAIDYEEELAAAQEVIARELFNIVYVPGIDELLASRVLDVYFNFVEQRAGEETPVDNFNFASFKELLDVVLGRANTIHGEATWSVKVAEALPALREKAFVTVDDFCELLDKLDTDILALQVLSRSEVQRKYEINVYHAYHAIPEIGSRLAKLEDKMVALHVLDLLGNQVLTMFSKRTYLGKVYTSQVSKENIQGVHRVLVEKSRKKDIEFSLPLSRKVLETTSVAEDVVLKYFVLERNVYGLLDTVYASPEMYEGCYQKFLEDLGLPDVYDIQSVDQKTFSEQISASQITEFYERNLSTLLDWVNRGLLHEVASNNGFQVIKAFDLFTSFYDLIVNIQREDESPRYMQQLLSYAGSFIVSYCPVIDSSAGDIDGGDTRTMVFARSSSDFIYDVPIEYLKQYNLSDIRVMIEGE